MASSLAGFEAERDRLRKECELLFDKKRAIEVQLQEYHTRLLWLDDKIDGTGVGGEEGGGGGDASPGGGKRKLAQTQPQQEERTAKVKFEVDETKGKKRSMGGNDNSMSLTQPEEYLTDPFTQAEEYLTDPTTQEDNNHNDNGASSTATDSARRVSSSPPSEMLASNTPLGLHLSAHAAHNNNVNPAGDRQGAEGRGSNAGNNNPFQDLWNPQNAQPPARNPYKKGGSGGANTLEKYFVPTQPQTNATVSSGVANAGQLQPNNGRRSAANGTAPNNTRYPWTDRMMHHLRNTFGITAFRGHQHEIINATMSGQDAFVVMRTGGGKSLTYQLPAVLESEGGQNKVTVVISPLISLIRDQEEQMNAIQAGSATSFTSGMAGGDAEHARRWGLVRDPHAGVAMIFVTPEKVGKSTKFKGEMEKLSRAGRLGRFVIDECHCACQWGHDFRPDYTKLGILKHHFPNTPVLAVTATASERVRHDCAEILKLGRNYRFFRSTANRPNLKYSVKCKPDSKAGVVKDMVAFIKENHVGEAGIVYTFSRKEADDVAKEFCNHGITARSYHSSVADSRKDQIQRSWMRNKTQVVVATIAFGLGINKPDVRFVLHHSLSKSLEAYYQESGRAGRDGKHANCVLYYSPKDVPRMLGMIYGEAGEGTFWSMAKYGQAHGDDALCRHIILATLGEADNTMPDQLARLQENCTTSVRQEVGRHCQTVAKVVDALNTAGEDCTLNQLVSKWRSKTDETNFLFLKDNPPAKDLSKEECERIIIYLLQEDVFHPLIKYTAYATLTYITLGPKGPYLLTSPNPRAQVSLPIRQKQKQASASALSSKTSPLAVADENGWISRNAEPAKAKTTKKSKASKAASKSKAKKANGGKKASKKKAAKSKVPKAPIEVVEINSSSSDEESDDDDDMVLASRASKGKKKSKVIAEDTDDDSEFELSE